MNISKEIQQMANQYAKAHEYLRAELLKKKGDSYIFSAVYSDEIPPVPVGLPFIFEINNGEVRDLPLFFE